MGSEYVGTEPGWSVTKTDIFLNGKQGDKVILEITYTQSVSHHDTWQLFNTSKDIKWSEN